MDGDEGFDRLAGGLGRDEMLGGRGADLLYGNAGRDDLAGGDGRDRLWGGRGNDQLEGGGGRDRYFAGSGDDLVLSRDRHAEVIRCGAGTDRVVADRQDRLIGCERRLRRTPADAL
jgi:Ca2+-binding RTX toxin-like protein